MGKSFQLFAAFFYVDLVGAKGGLRKIITDISYLPQKIVELLCIIICICSAERVSTSFSNHGAIMTLCGNVIYMQSLWHSFVFSGDIDLERP